MINFLNLECRMSFGLQLVQLSFNLILAFLQLVLVLFLKINKQLLDQQNF